MSGQDIFDWSDSCYDFYSETAVKHFMNPVNSGRLEDANGKGRSNSSCIEDYLEISIRVEPDPERVVAARFRAAGSPAGQACCSVLTELVTERPLTELTAMTPADVEGALGGLPDRKRYCAELAVLALRAAVEDYHQREALRDPTAPSRFVPADHFLGA